MFIYALGGGFGHLTRACSLARAAFPDIQARILTNSPYAAYVKSAMPELDLVALDPAMSLDQGCAEALHQIAAATADCLIVDTFPRGLGGELASVIPAFAGLKVYVQRDLNPHYAAAYNLNPFVEDSYDLVLVPGDTAQDSLGPFAQTVTTAPWLIRSRHEMPDRDRARQLLGLQDEKPCIAVCATGNLEELAWYGKVVSRLLERAPECDVRCIAPIRPDACPPECWVQYWPAMDLYAAADVVIGAAGYNTIYECVACGVPLVARAWQRKYDRQHLRACRAAAQACIRIVDEPEQAVAAALTLCGTGVRPALPHFENGAPDAVAAIKRALHRTGTHDIQRT
jgi:predicted glycosyltransferase